ncbi:NAD(P)H-quinone oxidoreductase [Marinicrinis lubricantis]|uniref:NAD(P)H-quinone oxidoreductase n=1 Tax=Marinicrinis lubricantis TaxID=2086470 RepID=A0ABW1IJG7_9BACL
MKAIVLEKYGGPEEMKMKEINKPVPGPHEVRIRVKAAGLNRADLQQRRGLYPPPQGASPIMGLEVSGEVEAIGTEVGKYQPGDRVCALLAGGGYAEYAVVHEAMCIPLPEHMSFEQGAAIPEAYITAYFNVIELAGLKKGEKLLIHAGASGVGIAAIHLSKEIGADAYVTAGSTEKINICLSMGAANGWNYHSGSFLPWIQELTGGSGVDVILDMVGAPYLQDNMKALRMDGRMAVIGFMGGAKAEQFPLNLLLSKRLRMFGSTLRNQPITRKAALIEQFQNRFGSLLRSSSFTPLIHSVIDWENIVEAHRIMENNENTGKIILRVH